MGEIVMHTVTIHWLENGASEHQVEGWLIGDPEGWLQLVFPDHVIFHRLTEIRQITVPRLKQEE